MSEFQGYTFAPTPEVAPQPASSDECGIRTTDYPCIKNGPLPADGPGSNNFSNLALAGLLLGVPYYVKYKLGGGFWTFLFFALIFFIPLLCVFWWASSTFSPRLNEKVAFPNKGVEHYLEFHDDDLKAKYQGQNKIPMETFHELYFTNKVSFKGDCLDMLEMRHDWATFAFTLSLFKFFLFQMMPEVILHTKSQDEEQVRDHYDRGDDFYTWFLGSRMIYTSGLISDVDREESLEEMQDNKVKVVCDKIDLKEGEKMLDLGCGWGTLITYASKVHGASCTGITLGRNQTKWGNEKLKLQGISQDQSKVVCCDYRDTPVPEGKYNKITCLEMAEHVGVRKFGSFLQQVYDMLDDDGLFFLQYAGLRQCWQYDDLVWGLFMNKYIFPGADASTPLAFVVGQLEKTGFEIVSTDNIGVHYSSTLWHWYRNWISNKEKAVNKYGITWYRIWEYFLAYSVIISRQGGATCFQIVLRKNLNSYHRVEYIPKQKGLLAPIREGVEKWFK